MGKAKEVGSLGASAWGPAKGLQSQRLAVGRGRPEIHPLVINPHNWVLRLQLREGREETKEEARTWSHSDLSTGLIAKRAISGKPPVWHMTLNL